MLNQFLQKFLEEFGKQLIEEAAKKGVELTLDHLKAMAEKQKIANGRLSERDIAESIKGEVAREVAAITEARIMHIDSNGRVIRKNTPSKSSSYKNPYVKVIDIKDL